MSHIPEQWEKEYIADDIVIAQSGNAHVIGIIPLASQNAEDNANLFLAAPDLLEACELALHILLEQIEIVCGVGFPISKGDRDDIDKLRAAIAKAKGK